MAVDRHRRRLTATLHFGALSWKGVRGAAARAHGRERVGPHHFPMSMVGSKLLSMKFDRMPVMFAGHAELAVATMPNSTAARIGPLTIARRMDWEPRVALTRTQRARAPLDEKKVH